MKKHPITLKKVKVHNLKNIDIELSSHELIVFTGVSGSGKSSLAFDTIYVEGQRRYIESLSTFARRYLGDMSKPDVESVTGLSPTIAIEQKTAGKNPRSTVGTLTEIYDYLRVLYARVGIPHCPISGDPVAAQSKERIIKKIQTLPSETKIVLLAPYAKDKKGEFKDDFALLMRKGFTKARVDGTFLDLTEAHALDKNLTHTIDVVIDRLSIQADNFSRIADAVTTALEMGKGMLILCNVEKAEETLLSTHAYSVSSNIYYPPLEPHDFSFNSPSGMCPTCHGLGKTRQFDLALIIDEEKSIAEDACLIASSYKTVRYGNIYDNLASLYHFDVNTPWKKLSEKAKKVFLYGIEKKWTQMHFVHPTKGSSWTEYVGWRGVIHEAMERYTQAKSDLYRNNVEKLMVENICPECKGARLKPYPAATLLQNKRISDITAMTVADCLTFFKNLRLDPSEHLIADELIKEISQRLQFLLDVGLHYLTLDRMTPSLSGGEAQRVRLASQVGCGLVGVIYVLDEPSIGLHPRDNKKLIHTLKRLRDIGNTVIVVEHDEETIQAADRIVDFGPGAGRLGGEVLVNGPYASLLSNPRSLTGAYLSGKKTIPIPKKRRKKGTECIEIVGATHHNLKNIDVKFPLGLFIAVTGVSGSGKSSLISDTLFPALANALHHAEHPLGEHKEIKGIDAIDKVISIDQSPIGRNPRSNPATYIKIFDEIRFLFSQLPESQARGYGPGRFSFNVRDGSCPLCKGIGMIRIDMDFMDDEWVICSNCQNRRFDAETLSILYKGKSIYDVLEMSVSEALEFFQNIPSLKRKLEVIKQVGLEYISLGQPSTTLSGGEAQRMKLAKELVRPASGKTFYILDEPTTGLHLHDIHALLTILQALVDKGNTVCVIEHNMDVVKTADYLIDLGPEGGAGGGDLVATGTPEVVSRMDTPTGHALHEILNKSPKTPPKKSKQPPVEAIEAITIKGACQNTLKNIDLNIPRNQISICTGPSGSGKSSLAFETVYAEGQRRYIESLSPYARQFVKQMPKAKFSDIEGLSPAIAIEQKASSGNPRSTIGTMTEIYDYLRILFARFGVAYSPDTGEEIKSITADYVLEKVLSYPQGEKIVVLAPLTLTKQDRFEEILTKVRTLGYLKIRLNGTFYEIDEPIPFDRKRKNAVSLVVDRLRVAPEQNLRLKEAIENAIRFSGSTLMILREEGQEVFFNLAFAEESTGKSYPPLTPHTFSFNSAEGMCLDCQGLGYQYGAHFIDNEEIMHLSLKGLLRILWSAFSIDNLKPFLKKEKIDPAAPLHSLTPYQLHLLMNGMPSDTWIETEKGLRYRWLGLQPLLAKAGRSAHHEIRTPLIPLLHEIPCPECQSTRLNPLARHVRIGEHSIATLCALSLSKACTFLKEVQANPKRPKLLDEVMEQLLLRLTFLLEVGLHYLSLDRKAPTLSNGETQRIRLARQLGSKLTGVLYVLDEPTIGLHPHDNARLNGTLKKLKDLGNTLLLVEHDPQTLKTADRLFDFGPGAGTHGGHLIAQGTYAEICKNKASLTGAYLSGKKTIPLPTKQRQIKEVFSIENARVNNLKNITVSIPLGLLTCLTGVSGSGKSTLMHGVILPWVKKRLDEGNPFNKCIIIDQEPIGHTVRSDVGTYVDALPHLRTLYSSLAGAKTRGLQPKHFSYNHRKGMCTHCYGLGYKKVEMLFLPPVKVTCDQCNGLRLNPLSLEVAYHDKNFGQLLDMTVDEAHAFFNLLPKATRIFETLISVGLGYLKLGQEMASLSGGEAQRMKLARELSKRGTGKTLYLLDEPTTGLHPDDIHKLLAVLQRLVDKGNTMIIIEHNLDVIKTADHIIDLGPDAGDAGGTIVCTGTPKEIASHPTSYTGLYLRSLL